MPLDEISPSEVQLDLKSVAVIMNAMGFLKTQVSAE